MTMTAQTQQVRCDSVDVGAVPSMIQVVPWGTFQVKGQTIEFNDESARLVVENFQSHGTDLPVDLEHQTLGGEYAAPDGSGRAPAYGWITGLDPRPGVGLFAAVSWTQAGRDLLTSRSYRYLSPVLLTRKADGVVLALHSAALTNKPAIAGMPAIVASAGTFSHNTGGVSIPMQDLGTFMEQCGGLNADLLILKLRSECRLAAGKEDWAKAQIASNRQGFLRDMGSRPILVAASAGGSGPDGARILVINTAGNAYDQQIGHNKNYERAAHISETLREMGLPQLSATEKHLVSLRGGRVECSLRDGQMKGSGERDRVIASASREFDAMFQSNPRKALCSKHAWINDALRSKTLPLLMDSERQAMPNANT